MAPNDLSPINVRFTEDQLAALRARSKADLIPVQRHIRRAIDLYLALLKNPNGPQLIEKLTVNIEPSGQTAAPVTDPGDNRQASPQSVVFT